jgi:hypothetical protein
MSFNALHWSLGDSYKMLAAQMRETRAHDDLKRPVNKLIGVFENYGDLHH